MENMRRKGSEGEEIIAGYLKRHGYKILDRSFYGRRGEIDIIAEKGGYIVFVEVKTRTGSSMGEARAAVGFTKQQHIINTAKEYIYKNRLENKNFRFDVAELTYENEAPKVNYIENAFWESR